MSLDSNISLAGVALNAGLHAATATIISSPIGAAGGAVFGAVSYLLGRSVSGLIKTDSTSLDSLVRQVMIGTFIALAATWGITSALGFSLTLGGAIALSLPTIVLTAITTSSAVTTLARLESMKL